MSTNKDGGPAFAIQSHVLPNGAIHPGCEGMSLRAWFAGQALAGIMACPNAVDVEPGDNAKEAVELADAMIMELNETSI